jgi:5-methyltetrahydropteroyltriglutamate--homocysteine methyltransferase
MRTHNLGYPRIGNQRELKKACESYWLGKISAEELSEIGSKIRQQNWQIQRSFGIDLIPTNDFSYYDQVLDTSLMLVIFQAVFSLLYKKRKNRFLIYLLLWLVDIKKIMLILLLLK